MSALRALFLASAALLCVAPADVPHFAPAAKSSVEKTITRDMSLDSTNFSMAIDDKEIPAEMLGAMTLTMRETNKIVVTDRYMKCADGRVLELDRTFDELVKTTHETSQMPGQAEEKTEDKAEESDLEGKTVHFSWNAKEEAYDTAFAGEETNVALLKGLEQDLDFKRLLPPEDTKVGGTWKVDGKAFSEVLSVAGDLHFHEAGKEEKSTGHELSKQLDDNLEGELEVTFEKISEAGEQRIAVINVKGELKTHGVDHEKDDLDFQLALDVEGTLEWDLTLNRIQSLDASAKTQLTLKVAQEREMGGKARTMHMKIELAGDFRLEVATKAL